MAVRRKEAPQDSPSSGYPDDHAPRLPRAIREGSLLYRTGLDIGHDRLCACKPNHLNCLSAKEWLKNQLGVWQFNYEGRDIRDKKIHPATFPISLATRVIELFTHEGELVLDPFVGSGTTLVAAQDTNRNAVGFDLQQGYIDVSESRLLQKNLFAGTSQLAVHDDASNVVEYLDPGSVSLVVTSPPYANLLNRQRRNKSRRDRERSARGRRAVLPGPAGSRHHVLGELLGCYRRHLRANTGIAEAGRALRGQRPGHLVGGSAHYDPHFCRGGAQGGRLEFRNTIIWDRTNIVNRVGIFGWPSYITMGTTFEYLLHFRNPRDDG